MRISHRRHPQYEGVDFITLEKLAKEVVNLCQPLHMILDSRGLCRLLWVGPLDESNQLLTQLPNSTRSNKNVWRLISCPNQLNKNVLDPDRREAIVAFDLFPIYWLRFTPTASRGGQKVATLWQPNPIEPSGWKLLERSSLSKLCQQSQLSEPLKIKELCSQKSSEERVLLLILRSKNINCSDRNLAELEGLVRSAGADPVAWISQREGSPNPQTIWGKGKLQEAALEVRRNRASLIITDRELTPIQARNLERLLDCPVMDRSELILDIFAQRASSASGRLQVELAQLRYRVTRLTGRGRSLSRQGGGIGTRGPGETQLEKDRRAIARRIQHLTKELKQLSKHRSLIRNHRSSLPRIALVGYTNAGKSSLLNSICNLNQSGKVEVANKPFATLDPTTRRLSLPQANRPTTDLLVTDTVGFIRELPRTLIEAFRATLEETLEADILLLIVDLSNPDWKTQLTTVNQLLDSMGAKSHRQVVANQIDRCEHSSIDEINLLNPSTIFVSATSGAGLVGLKKWLGDQIKDSTANQPMGTNQ